MISSQRFPLGRAPVPMDRELDGSRAYMGSQRYALAALSLWEEPRYSWVDSFNGSRGYMDIGGGLIYSSSILDPVNM
jgi:hypothetical protein